MDPNAYKDFTTSRGMIYHYYKAEPSGNKFYLLLLHGFPSTSYDWRHQVPFFKNEGYGLIVPDMLGYAGTSKPTDPMDYRYSLLAKDMAELLDHEKIEKVVAIGHDWGAVITARLANFYPDRLLGYAFLAVAYRSPNVGAPYIKYEDLTAGTKQLFGFETFGYWAFLASEGADKIVEENVDSFMTLLYPEDPSIWKEYVGATGGLTKWLSADRKDEPRANYVSKEEVEHQKNILLKGGMAGPLCYYKILVTDIDYKDLQQVNPANSNISKPVFFGGAKRDYVAYLPSQLRSVHESCNDLVVKEFDTGHWVMIEAKDEVNRELLKWLSEKF